ncbi:MAG: RNA chaperone Hfq [Acidobacteria bacterium]|nr:MAG: RNA chaperone Hfq [Acidobacteriota bacterium]REK00189.1 MAG: RNA chaperone Hfq [Acidobacteriota bacterium]
MSKHNINIQDGFLFQNLKDATTLEVVLLTGTTFSGRLRRFDRFALVLEPPGEAELLIYKHAIATIRAAVKD